MYLLGEVSEQNVTTAVPVTHSDALVALVANTYANELLDRSLRQGEFEVLGDLVQQIPVRRLTRPADLSHLSAFAESVLADLEKCGHPRLAAKR